MVAGQLHTPAVNQNIQGMYMYMYSVNVHCCSVSGNINKARYSYVIKGCVTIQYHQGS